MPDRLVNQCSIITGGATGMGLSMAHLFGSEGARVVILDIDENAGESAKKFLDLSGIDNEFFPVDVTDESSTAQAIAASADFLGGQVDILVNNAGIATFGSVESASLSDWNNTIAVNATGSFLCSKSVLPYMKSSGGSIINMGSVAALVGIPNMAAYCAGKAAVVALTKQMAVEYASMKIRVNCLCPGTVADTGMGRTILGTDLSTEAQAKRLKKYPLGRFGEPNEIANAALFLASSEASFVTGASLTVDGGMTAM